MFHLFYCPSIGYAIDLRFKDFDTRLLIDKEQAETIKLELENT